ncbi:MAG: 2-hydroxyacyl-CoA dehydratase [Desulfobacteraceae bacterium]|nr:2-hydroxyacyl-CoA dehydratase [Desulfobacteraceae bacterium]
MNNKSRLIGFTCAYTPLAIIKAAGYIPYRVLPVGEAPDLAGSLLHDNLCPHVKRVLDRAFAKDFPDLAGMVFVNSCDSMRRLADAWQIVRPDEQVIRLDLPATVDDDSVFFFAKEIETFANTLSDMNGQPLGQEQIRSAIVLYDELSATMKRLKAVTNSGANIGGRSAIQKFYNRASTEPVEHLIEELKQIIEEPKSTKLDGEYVPVFLFGNVLPDPEAFSFFESCGALIVEDDLCTGSRLFNSTEMDLDWAKDIFIQLARNILSQPPCARTFDPKNPDKMVQDLLYKAKRCKAKGVIGYTLKFCDPYLARLPAVREAFRKAGVPLLLLEGDCTLRSIGQHQTRIEAFIEMMG